MIKKYILDLIRTYPDIASGRKNFDYYEKRIGKNINLTKTYIKRKKKK